MYLNYYNLKIKPFQISTDPRFLWLGEKHKEALAILKYGVLDNKGFLLLTGDVGTGKTTLLNALLNSLGDEVVAAMVQDPGLGKMDFFNFVADAFDMKTTFKSKGDFLIQLKHFLFDAHQQNKTVLLIVDECQRLNQKLLEEIRLLSNIEKQNTKLINIFFVGQDEFNEIILRPNNRAIRQRITINYTVEALSESETEKYIRYRLRVAGAEKIIFMSSAIREIYKFSGGYPRLINIICDHALLTGYVNDRKRIKSEIVKECAQELKIPYHTKEPDMRATPEANMQQEKINVSYQPATASSKSKIPLYLIFTTILVVWLTIVGFFIISAYNKSGITAESDIRESSEDKIDISKADKPIEDAPATIAEKTIDTESEIKEKVEIPVDAKETGNDEKPDAIAPDDQQQDIVKPPAKETVMQTESAKPKPVQPVPEKNKPVDTLSIEKIIQTYGPDPYVIFGFDSNSLESGSYALLNDVALLLANDNEKSIILRGFTDTFGVRAYNIKLSEFRADIVKTYLIGKGIEPDRIVTIGLGPDELERDEIRPGRRVEIEMLDTNGKS
ncbi:MAG: AAA family ATPase, partial [Desulfobacteraceae bacterium]|nr:AAA family ATPase [Desulfobacteraceae bacterium]